MSQPDFTVEYLDPRTLLENPHQFRLHPENQKLALQASIREFGWVDGPLLNRRTGHLIDGHARRDEAIKEGRETIPVKVVDLSESDERRLIRMFDPITAMAQEDSEALDRLIAEIGDPDLERLLGELEQESGGLLEGADPDAIPEAVETRCKAGDLWALGEHRLLCGDSTVVTDVERLMGGERASLVFTDPPYNVSSDSRNYAQDAPTQRKTYKALAEAEWDQNFDIGPALTTLLTAMADDCAVYVCTSQFLVQRIWDWAAEWAKFHHYIVWCKPNPAPCLTKRHWTWATELLVYAVRGKHTCNFPETGHALNWWEIVSPSYTTGHPTQKPTGVPLRAIEFSSNVGDLVFDGFAGSGTTLIACEQTGRVARCLEIEPRYVDVCLSRYEMATGKQAELIA